MYDRELWQTYAHHELSDGANRHDVRIEPCWVINIQFELSVLLAQHVRSLFDGTPSAKTLLLSTHIALLHVSVNQKYHKQM